MMQLPAALKKCGISHDQELMLMESIKTLGNGTNLHFTTPLNNIEKDKVAVGMAETLKAWSKMEWYAFGLNLGKLLQELVTVVFPQKYTFDDNGTLRMQMLEAANTGPPMLSNKLTRGTSAKVIILAATMPFGMLMSL